MSSLMASAVSTYLGVSLRMTSLASPVFSRPASRLQLQLAGELLHCSRGAVNGEVLRGRNKEQSALEEPSKSALKAGNQRLDPVWKKRWEMCHFCGFKKYIYSACFSWTQQQQQQCYPQLFPLAVAGKNRLTWLVAVTNRSLFSARYDYSPANNVTI